MGEEDTRTIRTVERLNAGDGYAFVVMVADATKCLLVLEHDDGEEEARGVFEGAAPRDHAGPGAEARALFGQAARAMFEDQQARRACERQAAVLVSVLDEIEKGAGGLEAALKDFRPTP